MKDIVISLIFLTITILSANLKPNQNFEMLIMHKNHIELQFYVSLPHLPILLQQHILQKNKIYEIEINMGFRYHKQLPNQFPRNGIQTFIRGPLQISEQFKYLLSSLFSISTTDKFIINLKQVYRLYISNPNDKFCAEHLQSVVNFLLPCKDYSGIAQILNTKILFTGGYIGMRINWYQTHMLVKFFIEVGKDGKMNNLIKIKADNKCLGFKYSQIYDQQQNLIKSGIVMDYFNYSNIQIKQNKTNSLRSVKGDWYTYKTPKMLIHDINLYQSASKIIFKELFPHGFIITEALIKKNGQIMNPTFIDIKITKQLSGFTLVTAILIIQSKNSSSKYTLEVTYFITMLGFQQYQIIYGGGEQFVCIPMILIDSDNNPTFLASSPISDHLPQPDFSIPFQIMTVTLAVFGYLWVAIWRNYYYVISNSQSMNIKKSNQKKKKNR